MVSRENAQQYQRARRTFETSNTQESQLDYFNDTPLVVNLISLLIFRRKTSEEFTYALVSALSHRRLTPMLISGKILVYLIPPTRVLPLTVYWI